MDYLLDTHTLLWSLSADKNLSSNVQALLNDTTVNKVVSAVSFWEIAIKKSTGRLKIDFALPDLPSLIIENGCSHLAITANHTLAVASLPFHHKDRFDRLLIAQAQTEDFILLTKDANILLYDVATFW